MNPVNSSLGAFSAFKGAGVKELNIKGATPYSEKEENPHEGSFQLGGSFKRRFVSVVSPQPQISDTPKRSAFAPYENKKFRSLFSSPFQGPPALQKKLKLLEPEMVPPTNERVISPKFDRSIKLGSLMDRFAKKELDSVELFSKERSRPRAGVGQTLSRDPEGKEEIEDMEQQFSDLRCNEDIDLIDQQFSYLTCEEDIDLIDQKFSDLRCEEDEEDLMSEVFKPDPIARSKMRSTFTSPDPIARPKMRNTFTSPDPIARPKMRRESPNFNSFVRPTMRGFEPSVRGSRKKIYDFFSSMAAKHLVRKIWIFYRQLDEGRREIKTNLMNSRLEISIKNEHNFDLWVDFYRSFERFEIRLLMEKFSLSAKHYPVKNGVRKESIVFQRKV